MLEHTVHPEIVQPRKSDFYANLGINVVDGGPHPIAAEKIVAIDFPHICRVVLEPFEVHPANAIHGMVGVLHVFMKIDSVVAVMEIALRVLGPAAGGVTLEPEACLGNLNRPVPLDILHIAFHEVRSAGILVVCGQQRVPLVLAHDNMNLRNHGTVEHIAQCRIPVHVVGVVLVFGVNLVAGNVYVLGKALKES